MPAFLRGAADDGSDDLLGMKWVVGFPDNHAVGLPAIHGTVLMSDATTGLPRGVLDAGPVTAHRTAAVSGVAIEHWAPDPSERPPRIGLVGAGIQGRSHLPVLAHLLPGGTLVIHDRDAGRAGTLAAEAEAMDAFDAIATVDRAVDAIDGRGRGGDAGLVRAGSPGRSRSARSRRTPRSWRWTTTCALPRRSPRDAALFLVDDRGQFLANRNGAVFAGYPDPGATIGEALVAGTERPVSGRVLITHLGVGLADVVFGDALLRAAEARGLGTILAR